MYWDFEPVVVAGVFDFFAQEAISFTGHFSAHISRRLTEVRGIVIGWVCRLANCNCVGTGCLMFVAGHGHVHLLAGRDRKCHRGVAIALPGIGVYAAAVLPKGCDKFL